MPDHDAALPGLCIVELALQLGDVGIEFLELPVQALQLPLHLLDPVAQRILLDQRGPREVRGEGAGGVEQLDALFGKDDERGARVEVLIADD